MSRRVLNRLSAVQIRHLKEPGKYADGGGLALLIDKEKNQRWVFIYQWARRRVELGLGSARDVSLATARGRRAEFREALSLGIDPRTIREAKSRDVTFGQLADEYIDAMKPSWRNSKHVDQWVMTLGKYAAPIRRLRVDQITTEDIVRLLKPRWTSTPETADRLRGRIENVLDAAKARGLRDGDNPARWRGHLDQLLPKRRGLIRGHHAALPYGNIPAFMEDLRARDAIAARALEFAIFTAGRTGEVLGALWEEIDIDHAVWTVPAERMKAQREHRVPLSPQAMVVLAQLDQRDRTGLVFSKTAGRKPLSIMAMAMLLRRLGETVTVHGFRSSFRDWAAETTNFPNEVCEMAIAHAITGKAEAAYRRGDLFLKRRRLMEQWGAYCRGLVDGSGLETHLVTPDLVRLTNSEQVALHGLLSNARCSLCGAGWGDVCRTADDQPLPWTQSHERRYGRLVEDWSLFTDKDLQISLTDATASGVSSKSAVAKLELARRAMSPPQWLKFASEVQET